MQYIIWLGGAVAVGACIVWLIRTRKPVTALAASETDVPQITPIATLVQPTDFEAIEPNSFQPHAIVFGEDALRPGVRISSLPDAERFRTAKPLTGESGLVGRLSAGLQAVPTLLIEEGQRGKRLMEVVINGDLVRAKDGVGLRAWAVGSNNKISEHAKLFEAEKLQNLISAAAVWQVASVIVAQKHLADISVKLDAIYKGVQDVAHFLDEARRAKVLGTFEYFRGAAMTIGNGELSTAIRTELESCDRELLQIQYHLQQELAHRLKQSDAKKEFAGTKNLEKESIAKYEKLRGIACDMRLTLQTRALSCHVLSLYPGESALKQVKIEGLLRSAEEIEGQLQAIRINSEYTCEKFSSFWNKEETLAIRRAKVREAAQALISDLRGCASQIRSDVKNTQRALIQHDQPTSLVFEVENGVIVELRMVEPRPLAA